MIHKPMLASNITLEEVSFPTMMSSKLEGVRGEFTVDGLYTRPMKRFGNPLVELEFSELSKLADKHDLIIEGEFYIHGKSFSDISSICRRSGHPDTHLLHFYIFDIFSPSDPDMRFLDRYNLACILLAGKVEDVHVLEQIVVADYMGLRYIQDRYAEWLDQGLEGAVFKKPDAPYKLGRSTKKQQIFVRTKPLDTFDGKIIEVVERMENLSPSYTNEVGRSAKRQDKDLKAGTGMVAVCVVECEDFPEPVRVVMSRGLTDEVRYFIWENKLGYIGRHIKFTGMIISGMEQPRSPIFLDWRTDLD